MQSSGKDFIKKARLIRARTFRCDYISLIDTQQNVPFTLDEHLFSLPPS